MVQFRDGIEAAITNYFGQWRIRMADKEKYTEHTIHGSVPPDEWEKFLKRHFAPSSTGGAKSSSERAAARTSASDICASIGCPTKFGGGSLHHCSVDVESDGSTTIHCHYAVAAR